MMSATLRFTCDDDGVVKQWGLGFVGAQYQIPLSEAPENYEEDFLKHKWRYDGSTFIERETWVQELEAEAAAEAAIAARLEAERLARLEQQEE
jgi:hypothetical protein